MLAAAPVQAQIPPELKLLATLKQRVGAAIQQAVDYTCLETIQRFESGRSRNSKPLKLDTIRFEVAQIGRRELIALPGSHEFDQRPRSAMIGMGMSVSGVFYSFGKAVFQGRAATVSFSGWEVVAGRKLARYDYSIPQYLSGFSVSGAPGVTAIVGSRGQFWADSAREELVRLTAEADEIPVEVGMQRVLVDIRYGRVTFPSGEVMLPETSIATGLTWNGNESRNYSEFTQCRSFRAESLLKFENVDEQVARVPAKAPEPAQVTDEVLPSGVDIPIVLDSGLAAGESLVGDPLKAQVAADVRVKGRILIPAQTTVLGRLRRFERYDAPFDFVLVGIEFSEVVRPDRRLRFSGRMKTIRLDPSIGSLVRPSGPSKVQGGGDRSAERSTFWEFTPFDLPGVAIFYLTAAPFRIAPGLELLWRTQDPEMR